MSDRHPKWVRVEPGTVIPAGQPYRIEHPADTCRAREYVQRCDVTAPHREGWFVDSSWKPPLVLPTKPTWGIAVVPQQNGSPFNWGACGKWSAHPNGTLLVRPDGAHFRTDEVLDFIPLTDEQVQRIEAAR